MENFAHFIDDDNRNALIQQRKAAFDHSDNKDN